MSELPFQVYSQMRSGTHLTMALLHANFDFGRDLSLRVSLAGHEFDGRSDAVVPWGALFGSHEAKRAELNLDRAAYVIRHPIARAYSLWRFQKEPGTFEDFADPSLFTTWREHAESFGVHKRRVQTVRYERIRVRGPAYRRVLTSVRDRWRLEQRRERLRHVDGLVGWSPRQGEANYDYSDEVVATAREALGRRCLGYDI